MCEAKYEANNQQVQLVLQKLSYAKDECLEKSFVLYFSAGRKKRRVTRILT